MRRTCQVWFAMGWMLAAPGITMADGSSLVTTAPRPPESAYLQMPTDELPQRPGSGSSPGVSYGPTQLPAPQSPAPSPYVGGPPPVDNPPLLQPDFDSQRAPNWLSINEPTAWMLFPSFSQHLAAPVQVGGLYSTTSTLPSAPLDFTASPAIGVRFDLRNMGSVELGYRYMATEGSGLVVGLDPMGAAALRSRLDLQIMELTYARQDFQTHGGFFDLLDQDLRINDLQGPPTWIVSWDIGARVANFYWDSHAIGPTIDRQVVNYFIGGGAKVGVTLTRPIPALSMSLFSHVDLGAMMGGVRQQFSETAFDLNGNAVGFGYTARQQVQTVPTLGAQMGFTANGPHSLGQWQAGYQFEQWWAIGNLVGSSGDLLTHGVFVRWVRNY